MMSNPLILSVVGHTNVGKTSLLRTLSRDSCFGEVSDNPGTTRHVECIRIHINGSPQVELYDTPGLEDAMALRDYLDLLAPPQQRIEGPVKVERFLASPEAKGVFEQEAKVLRQLLRSDAALYVIDVREPVLPKYRDELAILTECAKPLLPVLNFIASANNQEQAWRQALSHLGLHAAIAFDAVSPPDDGERRLYESLALLIHKAQQTLSQLVTELQQRQQARQLAATRLIADTLLSVTAYCRFIPAEQRQEAIAELHQELRHYEQQAIEKLLKLYAFNIDEATPANFPLLQGRFADDLFSNEALKQMGIRLSLGLATGAAAGASVDLMLGGLTLGAATTVGAVIGGLSQSFRHYRHQLLGKMKGQYKLSVDDAIISLLALRLTALQRALEARGHAAQNRVRIDNPHESRWQNCQLPEALHDARAHPEWSELNPQYVAEESQRDQAVQQLMLYLPDFG
ncbi:MAG: GTPase/DUF3482 domain-containing protein [Enterobacteriaceae bacterium]